MPRTASRRRPGLRLHTNRIAPEEITHYDGLPVTTVPRTIADVAAAGLSSELVIQAVQEAIVNGLATPDELLAAGRTTRVRRLLQGALEELGLQ